jgi:N-acetylglucosaminyl-diphospho-decaprenol L-rhamnosyltransferase
VLGRKATAAPFPRGHRPRPQRGFAPGDGVGRDNRPGLLERSIGNVQMILQPILSVIIVAFRSRDEIGDCLASLPRTIAGRPVEAVVVDNSGGDGTGAVVRSEHPWVGYVDPGENLGFGRANNLGFARTRGECVLFLNPDTIVNAAALGHCVARALEEPDLGVISPRLELADGSMDLACRRGVPTLWDGFCRASGLAGRFPSTRLFAGYNLTHLPADGTYDVGLINGAFMLGRREVFAAVAGPGGAVFDPDFFMYGDDIDLCLRVAQAGYRVVYDGRHAIVHLKGVSVAKERERMSELIFDANRDVFLKHFNPRGSAWVAWRYRAAFGLWKRVARLRARLRGHRAVRPL